MKQSPRIILRYFKINNLRYPVDAIIEIRDKIHIITCRMASNVLIPRNVTFRSPFYKVRRP